MRRIEIYDTTLRDGSQAEGIAFSLFDKLLFAQRLDEFGIDFIEGGYPASNEKDAQFFERIKEQPLKNAVLTAFGMTCRKNNTASEDEGLRAIVAAGTLCLTIVGKSSLFQVEEILRTPREENLRMIADTFDFIRGNGLRVIFDAEHFFDGYRYDADYSLEVLRTAAEH
ncbi:MAG: citramalate synthase, partial [Planctomycetaceae bacterium]|nr:citramalate synthase [Planctomycetaceae bacterium]